MKLHRRVAKSAIWSVSLWPAFVFIAQNFRDVAFRGVDSLAGVALLTLVLGGAGHLLYVIASRRPHGGGWVVFGWPLLVGLLFGYAALGDLTEYLRSRLEIHVPRITAWLLLCALALCCVIWVWHRAKPHVLAATFCLVGGGVAFFQLLGAIYSHVAAAPPAPLNVMTVEARPPRLPGLNVYYILVDAYGGKEGLKAALGFDNSPFYDEMKSFGFVDVSTGHSNYLRTVQTLGGIFWLDYPQTDAPETWWESRMLYPDIFDNDRPPPLVARLSSAGYFTWHSATAWGGCSHRYTPCLGDGYALEPDYLRRAFMSPTPIGIPMAYLGAESRAFPSVTSRLPYLLAQKRPFFIFAHELMAHPPFLADAQCRPRKHDLRKWNEWAPGDKAAYLATIRCVNSQLSRLVGVIVRLNPNALIVLQSDHGSAFGMKWEEPMASWTRESLEERSSYLNLVRAPLDCRKWLDRPLGQINTARFVLACIEGHSPDYLPEHTYISTYSLGKEQRVIKEWKP